MALSCLTGANPLPTSRTSCPGSTTSAGRGSLKEGVESTSVQPSSNEDGIISPTISTGQNGGSIMSAPSPTPAPPSAASNAGNQQQQLFQQQQQQAAMAAAGLFRLGSAAAGYPGVVPPHHLPSLMASLGVPLHHHHHLPAGGMLGMPGSLSPFNFPSLSPQHQAALISWSAKLAQATALGVAVHDVGLGSILTPGGGHHHHQQQHSPDSSSSGGHNKKKNLGYTAGLIVKDTSSINNKTKAAKTVKAQVARRNAKNKALLMDDVTTGSGMDGKPLIIEPPLMVSPVGTSSPPSVNGSSGGSSTGGHHNKSSSSRSSSVMAPTAGSDGLKSSNGGDVSVNGGKVFSCSICHRTFGYKHVLQNHERTHTGEKPFECKQCGKRFTRDHHLKTHMRLHTGEKPYNCTHCDRQFVQVANLRRHLRVHTGERPYACELCTSRFSDSNQLKAHMLIHKGEKPFQCQLCSGKFRRRHHLMHHKCPKDPTKHLKMLIPTNTEDDVESEPPPTPSSYASPPDEEEEEEDGLMDDMMLDEEDEELIPSSKAKRERKPRETRRVVRHQPAAPEQTEPEDLSTSKSGGGQSPASRIRHASTFSVGSTGGWSAAGSVSIGGLSSDEEPDDDDLSDTEEMIQRATKKRRPAIDAVLRQTHQV